MNNLQIKTPTLLVNLDQCRRNIRKIKNKTLQHDATFRPHFKTHQSIQIGKIFREEGISSITVSSVRMATYFARDNWQDITIAFPVNWLEIDEINVLARQVRLGLLVESIESVHFLQTNLQHPVNAWIKIDVGTHRTGVSSKDFDGVCTLAEALSVTKKLHFRGLLAHAGHTYRARGGDEISSIHEAAHAQVLTLKHRLATKYPSIQLSYGDTPSASQMHIIKGVDEWRPGNLVFYDWMQHQIGSCETNEIALAMVCPVVALHPERNELVVYGGGVHFSKDFIEENGHRTYGQAVVWNGNNWGAPIKDTYLSRLSQEHGIVHAPDDLFREIRIGSLMAFLPIHACLTADAMTQFLSMEGERLNAMKQDF